MIFHYNILITSSSVILGRKTTSPKTLMILSTYVLLALAAYNTTSLQKNKR